MLKRPDAGTHQRTRSSRVFINRPGPDAGEQVSLVCTAWPACSIGAIGARASWFDGRIALLIQATSPALQTTTSALALQAGSKDQMD